LRPVRRILVDGRTAVNYTLFAPVHRAMRDDARVRFSFIASQEPRRTAEIFREAGPDAHLISPLAAALTKFDAYVTSDFMWPALPRGACRIQMFHGVGGKYGFDAPTESLRVWQRLFFVNRRRLANCIAAGALDADSPAVRLVGMPKVDCLVDGSLRRDGILATLGLAPDRPTILYAPTWSPDSSLNGLGVDLVQRIGRLPVNLIVKLHDRSRDLRERYSGGVDWAAALSPHLRPGQGLLASGSDVCPYLAAADLLVTDHSSAGFEFLLLDRPLVRIHLPRLVAGAAIHPDYVALLSEASESVADAEGAIAGIERGLADPRARAASRRAIAADLFHGPGTATARCVAALYEAIDLPRPASVAQGPAPSTRATRAGQVVESVVESGSR
jgi:hypothetical protein